MTALGPIRARLITSYGRTSNMVFLSVVAKQEFLSDREFWSLHNTPMGETTDEAKAFLSVLNLRRKHAGLRPIKLERWG